MEQFVINESYEAHHLSKIAMQRLTAAVEIRKLAVTTK